MNPIQEQADVDVDGFKHCVQNLVVKVDKIEQKVNDLALFYSSLSKKNKSRASAIKRHHKQPPTTTKRMQDLMRQFATIFCQITSHKWAHPFDSPVDVEALGLDDYYEVIDKPMDFGTIKNRMDENGYKNVREICSDVRLVFKNAMTYNDEKSDVHIMAKTLLAKFEEKWLLLLHKVIEEENRVKEEETELRLSMQLAEEAANAKMARRLSHNLSELERHLDQLRFQVLEKCRKVSCGEKKWIHDAAGRLTPEDLGKTVEIIAENNPNIDAAAEELVVAELDTLSEMTLWKLIFFMKGAFQAYKVKEAAIENNKRKQDICNALAIAKTPSKKRKK